MTKPKPPRPKIILGGSEGGFPPIEELEQAVETREKCPKCGKGIRAIVEVTDMSDSVTGDMDVLLRLYCRDAGCGWMVGQWRTWHKNSPW